MPIPCHIQQGGHGRIHGISARVAEHATDTYPRISLDGLTREVVYRKASDPHVQFDLPPALRRINDPSFIVKKPWATEGKPHALVIKMGGIVGPQKQVRLHAVIDWVTDT